MVKDVSGPTLHRALVKVLDPEMVVLGWKRREGGRSVWPVIWVSLSLPPVSLPPGQG